MATILSVPLAKNGSQNSIGEILRYARQQVQVLQTRDASSLLQLSPDNRINAMKGLSSLAKYTGLQNTWKQIREQYGLTWSTGTEKIDAFTRFFEDSKSLDLMLQWLREALQFLPSKYVNLLLFCTLTGMRGSECIESVRFIKSCQIFGGNYYNPERQILQHYLYPNIFIRGTKVIYISIVNEQVINIACRIENNTTQNGLKRVITRRKLSMHIKYCRKIYASCLRKYGIECEIIHMLQGRVGKNIFVRHYTTPSNSYHDKVLVAVDRLREEIIASKTLT